MADGLLISLAKDGPLSCASRYADFFARTQRVLAGPRLEAFPDLASAHARRTQRQGKALGEIAFALGGRAGARLAHFLGLPVSFWTLLRLLRHTPLAPTSTPLTLGVDDFSWRKGDHYGTILVDLQAHRPIDLLPDRETETFAQWLREHLGIQVISRDRAGGYADGAKKGAPDALQGASRYHLVANLREAVQRYLDRERHCLPPLQERGTTAAPEEKSSMKQQALEERPSSTHAQALRHVRRGKRYERYQAVVALHQQGVGRRAIARQTRLSRNTVHRYLEAGSFPEQQARKKRPSSLDPYLPYLHERWEAGCQNAVQLFRELQSRGYQASSPTTLRALISDWRASSPATARRTSGPKRRSPPPPQRRLSSRQASFLFVKQPEALSPTHQSYLEQIRQASDEMKGVYELSQQFVLMARVRQGEQLDAWLKRIKEQGPGELRGFASGIRRDYAAVRAGLSRPESNGQVEGHNTRLKYLKRQMYGRAKFDLLRLRVLHAA